MRDQSKTDEKHAWDTPELSRYVRTTWMLNAQCSLEVAALKARVRFLSGQEAELLTASARRRNVFARHSRENNFYIQRIGELSNTTVLEVLRPGDPDDMLSEAESVASQLERLAVLSSTFALQRPDLCRLLAITADRNSTVDVTFGRQFYYLRSKAKRAPEARGINIDNRFANRFERCGFPQMFAAITSDVDIARRLESASRWLFESRQESSLSAAIVKTAIALEALLIGSDSEPLSRSLSERAAYLLSQDPEIRRAISKNVKKFYAARSAVVHGGRRRKSDPSPKMMEGIDRLALLLCLTTAANMSSWSSIDDLIGWCENQKWGASSSTIARPFSGRYLNDALRQFDQ